MLLFFYVLSVVFLSASLDALLVDYTSSPVFFFFNPPLGGTGCRFASRCTGSASSLWRAVRECVGLSRFLLLFSRGAKQPECAAPCGRERVSHLPPPRFAVTVDGVHSRPQLTPRHGCQTERYLRDTVCSVLTFDRIQQTTEQSNQIIQETKKGRIQRELGTSFAQEVRR